MQIQILFLLTASFSVDVWKMWIKETVKSLAHQSFPAIHSFSCLLTWKHYSYLVSKWKHFDYGLDSLLWQLQAFSYSQILRLDWEQIPQAASSLCAQIHLVWAYDRHSRKQLEGSYISFPWDMMQGSIHEGRLLSWVSLDVHQDGDVIPLVPSGYGCCCGSVLLHVSKEKEQQPTAKWIPSYVSGVLFSFVNLFFPFSPVCTHITWNFDWNLGSYWVSADIVLAEPIQIVLPTS